MDNLDDLTFEQALQRLEQLVAELDSGDLSLEEALARFTEGSALKDLCERKLAAAEAQVEELLQQSAAADAAAVAAAGDADDDPFGDN